MFRVWQKFVKNMKTSRRTDLNTKAVVLVGKMGVGKSTLAHILQERFNCPCIEVSEIVRKYIKKSKRGDLQDYGIKKREQSPNWLIDLLHKEISKQVKDNENIDFFLVVGIREPNLLIDLQERYDAFVIKMQANKFIRYKRLYNRLGSYSVPEFHKGEKLDVELGIDIVLDGDDHCFNAYKDCASEEYEKEIQNLETFLHNHCVTSTKLKTIGESKWK